MCKHGDRKPISTKNREHHEREVKRYEREIADRQRKLEEGGLDFVQEEQLKNELRDLEIERQVHNGYALNFFLFGDLEGEDESIAEKLRQNRTEKEYIRDSLEESFGPVEKRPEVVEIVNDDNAVVVDRTNEIIETFWESYQTDSKVNLGLAIAGLSASIGFGIVSLGIAIATLYYGVNPNQPSGGGGNQPSGGGSNAGWLNTNFAASNARAGDERKMTDAEIEDMMQHLVASKGVIASGVVPQERLWRNIADQANATNIEDQNLTLIFVQEAAVELSGTREFFWLDPSDAQERYEVLRAAHKKSGKFADVYLEAAKVKHNGKEVPMFHVASLIQYALRLIKHDSLNP